MYIYIYHHYNTHSNKIKQKWRKIGTFLRFKGCYDQLKKVFSTYYPTLGMLRSASAKSRAFKLARNAMSAFYEPKAPLPGQPDNKKEGYDRIPLSAILGHVNEGDDWRSKLLAAVR